MFKVPVAEVTAGQRLGNLMCRLGWHSWGRVVPPTYRHPRDEYLALTSTPAMRACQRCPQDQHRDDHCLGLNPPEYVQTWYNVSE